MFIESLMPSNHLIICFLFLLLPLIFPSIRSFPVSRLFTSGGLSFSISPSNEYSGLISFRINWFDLLSVQRTIKSPNSHIHTWLLENHSFDYMDLCQQSDPLVFSMLSRLVIAFLPRSKHLLISWLQSPSAVILEPKKMKSVTVSIVPHLFTMKWWDQMPWSSFFKCWVLRQCFHSPLSPSSRGSLIPLHFLP